MAKSKVRKGMPSVAISKAEFIRRARERFFDPAFDPLQDEIGKIIDAAWNGYHEYRKTPRTKRAGPRYADPDYELPIEWLKARDAIARAGRHQKSPTAKSRILLINGSPRSDQTCPGEISKTFRLAEIARRVIEQERGFETELLDLSLLASQYGRQILPCKACVSTAQPLCHWPCSCYPNHALGQVNDWMSEIYPMWAAAHGVMIVTPVHWYQAPTVLKAMIDRLVCDYESYATSHEALDRDRAFQEETRNAARALVQAVKLLRRGRLSQPDARLREVRAK
ncbi:MAG: flavodoxin family protein [Rhodospirillales bacterium]|nr:flavodoxin family protein [Rhodospirillales bacterium]